MYEDSDTVEVEAPVAPARLTNQQILLGQRVDPPSRKTHRGAERHSGSNGFTRLH